MAIQFYLTERGKSIALNAEKIGLTLSLSQIAVGSSKYDAKTNAPGKQKLETELARYPLNGGSVEPESKTLRFVTSIDSHITADIFEVGLITSEGDLFAIASTTGNDPILKLVNDISTIVTFGFKITDVNVENIQILIDPNSPISVQLMNQHLAHTDPHPQYAMLKTLNAAITRIIALENKVYDEVKVGDLFITTNNFANADEVRAHKGYGTWQKYGNGHALVAVTESDNQNAPEFMRNVGGTGGEYKHQLTKDELPNFSLKVSQDLDNWLKDNNAQVNGNALLDYDPNAEKVVNTSSIGGDQPHNNIQPSIIVGVWKRMPDGYVPPEFALKADKVSVDEGQQVLFTLNTKNIAQNTSIKWKITGIQSTDISPTDMEGTFFIDAIGMATLSKTIVADNLTEGAEILRLSLTDYPQIFCDVVINDTSVSPIQSGCLLDTQLTVQSTKPSDPNPNRFLGFMPANFDTNYPAQIGALTSKLADFGEVVGIFARYEDGNGTQTIRVLVKLNTVNDPHADHIYLNINNKIYEIPFWIVDTSSGGVIYAQYMLQSSVIYNFVAANIGKPLPIVIAGCPNMMYGNVILERDNETAPTHFGYAASERRAWGSLSPNTSKFGRIDIISFIIAENQKSIQVETYGGVPANKLRFQVSGITVNLDFAFETEGIRVYRGVSDQVYDYMNNHLGPTPISIYGLN